MSCMRIYEVHTPSVRLSRFATHVETGRPRKSIASIHGAAHRGHKFREIRVACRLAGYLPRFAARNFSISDNSRTREALDDSQ